MNFRLRVCSSHLALVVLGVTGCGGDDSNATGNFSTSMNATSSETGTTIGTTISGDGDGDSGDGDGATTGDGDGDGDPGDGDGDGDTSADTDTMDGDGDGDPGDGDGDGDPTECPPAPGDDECTLCVKDACCAESMECEADADCVCMSDCINGGGGNNECKNMCDIQGNNQNFQAFNGCVDDFCQMACGG
jgi:hypothetical protein